MQCLVVSDDLDQNLGGDGFTLSRLLGGATPSPQTGAGGGEGLGVPTPPTSAPPSSTPGYSGAGAAHAHSGPEYTQSGGGPGPAANPGYRPWEAEQQEGAGHHYPVSSGAGGGASVVTTMAGARSYYPYTVPHPHLPSFQSQFHYNDNIPPPNTQAPPGPPVPTTGETAPDDI